MIVLTRSECRQAKAVVAEAIEHKEIEPADAILLNEVITDVELWIADTKQPVYSIDVRQ